MVAGGKRSAATGWWCRRITRPGGAQDFDKLEATGEILSRPFRALQDLCSRFSRWRRAPALATGYLLTLLRSADTYDETPCGLEDCADGSEKFSRSEAVQKSTPVLWHRHSCLCAAGGRFVWNRQAAARRRATQTRVSVPQRSRRFLHSLSG